MWLAGSGSGWGVRRCDQPGGAWSADGGHADGRWREVSAAGGATAQRGFEGRGATQAAGDAGEDGGEVGGAEGFGEEGEAWGGGALLDRGGELLAVVDQFADDAEDAAEAAGCVCVGPRWIGVRGSGRGVGRRPT